MTRRLVFVAGVLMLAAAAATLVYRAVGPSDGTRTGYVTRALSSAGLAVAPLPGADTPLRSGDRVTAVDGVELERWLGRSVGDPLAATRGDSVAYSISRDGRTSEVEVPIGSYPLLETLIESWGTVLFCLVTLAVAAFVFARRPREPAAQALFVIGVSLTGSTIPWLLGFSALDLATGIGFWLWVVAAVAVYSVFWSSALHFTLIFPRRLAFVQRHPWVTALVYIGPLALFAGWALVGALTSPSVLDVLGSITALQLAFVLVDAGLLIALQVVQFRSAPTPVARDQARWLAWGGLMAIVLTVALWFGPQALTGEPLLPWSAIGLPGLFFTAAMAVAVLRHRLFDIDVVINRSLVYGALSVVVAAAYGVSVVVLRSVFGTDANLAVSLLSTGVAAAIALPVRDGIQRSVNRLMYGDRDDPYRAVTRLGERLGTSLTTEEVLPTVVATVATSLRLPYVAIELRQAGELAVAASTGAVDAVPAAELVRLPLIDGGETIGDLVVAPRSPGESFSRADRALLGGLAQEAGRAARSVRLAAELDRSRRQLVAAREEERRRLRRDLHDGLGPTLAAARLKVQAVRAGSVGASVLDSLDADLAGLLEDVRRISRELRPPALDELGLMPALRAHAARFALDGALEVRVDGPDELPALPAAVESAAYMIAMEALTNVRRHSAALHCAVRVRLADALEIEIEDDGTGVPAATSPGVGLRGMRERVAEVGGTFEIGPHDGVGTLVVARLPVATESGA